MVKAINPKKIFLSCDFKTQLKVIILTEVMFSSSFFTCLSVSELAVKTGGLKFNPSPNRR